MFHAQELGSYAQGQESLAVFKVTARDQGHYKGPSGGHLLHTVTFLVFLFIYYFFSFYYFLCPRDDSQGALRFAPVCPSVCLSVRPFVTLYGIEFV